MLNASTAHEFVHRLKASQSVWDGVAMVKYILATPFVTNQDGHDRFDYVMTRLMNRSKPGGPYQCEGQAMPGNAFVRAGFAAFSNMLKPVLDQPDRFSVDLTQNLAAYTGQLMLLSSECSFIGYAYQQTFHQPLLPRQTLHVKAPSMGHNMLTLNPDWSVAVLEGFLSASAPATSVRGVLSIAGHQSLGVPQ